MKFYLDCEFHDRGDEIDLWSIAIVCEDGRACHFVLKSDWSKADEWLKEHVIPHLIGLRKFDRSDVCANIRTFMRQCLDGQKAEFWGYYCAHDWFLFCRLFGGMMSLPPECGMYCREMMQLPGSVGFNCALDIGDKNHCALHDAEWMRAKHAEVIGSNENGRDVFAAMR